MRLMLPALLLLSVLPAGAHAQEDEAEKIWDRWIERDFPFFSTVVDARGKDRGDNLTPRAFVFHFGQTYVAWDVDMLRIAAIWTTDGEPFTGRGMAVFSYPDHFRKVPDGQRDAPKPRGDVWVHNSYTPGVYPHVVTTDEIYRDPRPTHPESPSEMGRGGLPPDMARFRGIRYEDGGVLEYTVGQTDVSERLSATAAGVVRALTVAPHDEPISIVLAKGEPEIEAHTDGDGPAAEIIDVRGRRVLVIPPADQELRIRVTYRRNLDNVETRRTPDRYWPDTVEREIEPYEPADTAATLELLPLPAENPWSRAVRVAGVDFLDDGTAALVTFDGEVWLGERFVPGAKSIRWRRFAAGLHEPLSIGAHDGALYVFDRSGIWRLRDADGDGEADFHELVCSQIDQTAETREFASDMQIEPDGSFLICKPAQTGSTVARSSGAVLRISPDGAKIERLAYGLRQPFLGLDTQTGRILVTDQQGHYVPTTPVHQLEPGAFYGFLGKAGEYPEPIAAPLTWIPHHVCGSAASVHWPRGPQLGPLDGACVLLAFTEPGMLQVFTEEGSGVTQGAAARIPMNVDFAPLKGAQNPADGMFYVAGFKVWGSKAEMVTALARLRVNPDAHWPLPQRVIAGRRGVYLRFADPLDPEFATKPTRYDVDRWNYLRTPGYGSPHYKLDGAEGRDRMPVSQVKLSEDRRSVFIGVPEMLATMQIGVRYDLRTSDGTAFKHEVYLTPHRLRKLDLTELGFADDDVDLSGGELAERVETPTVETGKAIYTTFGCAACHSVDGTVAGKTGPSWKGLFNAKRVMIDGGATVVADEAYLRESILNPTAKVAEGAVNGEAGMPAYAGVLSDAQIEALVLYIKSLGDQE